MIAESWSHLCGELFEESWQESLGRYRSHFAFKGLSHAHYELSTTLYRLGRSSADVERHLLRNFKKYALREANQIDSLWNWLALGQHHGLPTRLLDWTYSPFVALHFATTTLELGHCDAIVWCVDYVRAHELLPKRLRRVVQEEGSDVWTADLLDHHVPTWEALNDLGDGDDVMLFFEPPSVDQRIVNQYALFSVLSNPDRRIDDWLASHPELAKRVIIPKDLVWEVRDKLDQANVNERVLFPGLDGLSHWLRRHYSQHGTA